MRLTHVQLSIYIWADSILAISKYFFGLNTVLHLIILASIFKVILFFGQFLFQ